MVKVSVVVPAYNAEKMIVICLDSLVKQTMAEAEFIIVNDGSKDNTESIIQEYAIKDKRIKLINQTNQGVSEARNTGLAHCTGKYVAFVDADDCLLKNDALDTLYKNAEHERVDIVAYGNVTSIIGSDYQRRYHIKNRDLIVKETDIYKALCLTLFNPEYRPSVWNKLYRKEIISNIKFKSYKEIISEDTLFNIEAFISGESILLLDEDLYGYHIVEESLSHQRTYPDVTDRICKTIKELEKIVAQLPAELYEAISSFYIIELLGTETALMRLYNKAGINQTKNALQKILTLVENECGMSRWTSEFSFLSLMHDKKKAKYYNSLRRLLYKKSHVTIVGELILKTEISRIIRKKHA